MLDLLLTAEKNGLIDNEGVKEEVDTFTFEVSKNIAQIFLNLLSIFTPFY